MYSIDISGAQTILRYRDIFSGDIPDLIQEIRNLNMHKSISIICELIQVRDDMLPPIQMIVGEFSIPFETVLKKQICEIDPQSPREMLSNPLLRRDVHIISIQMLLILLKKIIKYGNYETANYTNYEISEDDYKEIIRLQLVVSEEVSQSHEKNFDTDHFIYSTYHLNYKRNLSHEITRMYYMLEKIGRDRSNFCDIQNEYRDYYNTFTEKYEFTPTQYLFLLFGELRPYYENANGLAYGTVWRNVEKIYKKVKAKDILFKIISVLAQPVENYKEWASQSDRVEWDFSKFFEFPFIMDQEYKYISISDITLRNAFFEKIYWLIRNCYPEDDSRAMAFFGRLFERYIQDLTADVARVEYKYIKEFSYKVKRDNKKSSDAYLKKGSNLLAVEAKGFSVLLDCMIKNEKVEDNNNKLFVKPILQADSCLANVINDRPEFADVNEAYIISVTMDSINAVPNYYNQIYKDIENKKECLKTKYYFNFNIEEYEMLMYLVEQQIDIFSLLKDYYDNKRLQPFSNFIQEKYSDISMPDFMETIYKELSAKMKEMLFD